MKQQYNFELLMHWPNGNHLTVKKAFYAKNVSYAWAAAKRWRNNYLAICGKNEAGEQCDNDCLSRDYPA